MVNFRRHEEAEKLAKKNQIIAVSRLISNQLTRWDEFWVGTDPAPLAEMDRVQIRLQLQQSITLVKKLVKEFNRFFLHEASERVFLALFREIKASIPYGLRLPILEFEQRFTPIRREIETGRDQRRPYHSTICITLTGLTYVYPEWHFAQDILTAFDEAKQLDAQLAEVEEDPNAKERWLELRSAAIRRASIHRWCVTSCFSLLEVCLSELAWRCQKTMATELISLPARDRKTIDDSGCSFRDRLVRIPRIVTGRTLWDENDQDVDAILDLRGGWDQSTRTRYCDTTRGNGWQQRIQTSSYIAETQPYSPRAGTRPAEWNVHSPPRDL